MRRAGTKSLGANEIRPLNCVTPIFRIVPRPVLYRGALLKGSEMLAVIACDGAPGHMKYWKATPGFTSTASWSYTMAIAETDPLVGRR